MSPSNSVSWTNKPVNFYIYTKKKIARSVVREIKREMDLAKVVEEKQKRIREQKQQNQIKAKAKALLKRARKRKMISDKENVPVKRARLVGKEKVRDETTGRYVSGMSTNRRKPLAVLQATSPDRHVTPISANRAHTGNKGLIACAVQVFTPNKIKTLSPTQLPLLQCREKFSLLGEVVLQVMAL